jgi:hypothetical protein
MINKTVQNLADQMVESGATQAASRTKRAIGLGESSASGLSRTMKNIQDSVQNMFDYQEAKQKRERRAALTNSSNENMASWVAAIQGAIDKAPDTSGGSSKTESTKEIFGSDEEESTDSILSQPVPEPDPVEDPVVKEEVTTTEEKQTIKFVLPKELYGKKGVQLGEPISRSYFNKPIPEGELRGNSRKAGDISVKSQEKIISRIVDYGRRMDLSDREIAIALATVRYESGFNPDAAAKSSSAVGLGQFVNQTWKDVTGGTDRNSVDDQIQALFDLQTENTNIAEKKGYGEEYIYAMHHDGPNLELNGLSKSKKHVMPFVPKYEKMIKEFF